MDRGAAAFDQRGVAAKTTFNLLFSNSLFLRRLNISHPFVYQFMAVILIISMQDFKPAHIIMMPV